MNELIDLNELIESLGDIAQKLRQIDANSSFFMNWQDLATKNARERDELKLEVSKLKTLLHEQLDRTFESMRERDDALCRLENMTIERDRFYSQFLKTKSKSKKLVIHDVVQQTSTGLPVNLCDKTFTGHNATFSINEEKIVCGLCDKNHKKITCERCIEKREETRLEKVQSGS